MQNAWQQNKAKQNTLLNFMKDNELFLWGFLFVLSWFFICLFKREMEEQPRIRNALYVPGIITCQAWN